MITIDVKKYISPNEKFFSYINEGVIEFLFSEYLQTVYVYYVYVFMCITLYSNIRN